MNKKRWAIGIALLILVVVGNYLYLTPRASTETQMEKDMEVYLYEERGYAEEDILTMEVTFDPWKATGMQRYNARVYFADEPENDYGYSYGPDGEIEPAYFGNGRHNP
ncbi:DUF3139 domain-containing protein [Planococcus ruber]|uniref:DUF3139 domain-containing protein n=1 Tax=Planococcus ruber TaxID=2027871 RepID=UPI001FF0374D|nr:DUF3139 domain-containing protein [Planococcus ruber]MCJ1908436.1 DUF3139 domain-containing protein [Planococcus ruber]